MKWACQANFNILEEAICIPIYTNALGKGMNPFPLFLAPIYG